MKSQLETSLRRSGWTAVAVLLSLVAVPSAHAWSDATSWWTAVSGYTGAYKKQYTPEPYGVVAQSVSFLEKSDDPVEILTSDGYLAGYPYYGGAHLEIKAGNQSSKKTAFPGSQYFLTAIRVCTNNKGDVTQRKIKGIEVWGKKFDSRGNVLDTKSDKKTRTNCSNWHTKVHCRTGEVMTGIRAYYNSASDGFRGISIRCSQVTW